MSIKTLGVKPDHIIFHPGSMKHNSFTKSFINLNLRFMHTTVEGPVLWFRKNVVEAARTGEVGILWAQQRKHIFAEQRRWFLYTVGLYFALQQPVWYPRQFQRVTSIEDCDVSDMTCRYSMPSQYSNFFCWLKTSLLSVFSLAQVWSKPAISAWLGCWSWNAGPSQVGLDFRWCYSIIYWLIS